MIKTITLAGGCFWGTEKYFAKIPGVTATEVGYANGRTERPTYEQVCHENTGHAEVVRITYDDEVLSLSHLLLQYYDVIDPTSLNKQGGDTGTQYRTGIYYEDPKDREVTECSLKELQKRYAEPIRVELTPLDNYAPAEAYHQRYLDKNPGGYCHIGADKFEKAAKAQMPLE